MNESDGFNGSPRGWRNALVILAGTTFFAGSALADDKPADVAPSAGTAKPAPHVSPYVLAAQRRAQEGGDALQPRVGLQAQMRKNAVRHHLAPARPGT